MAEVKNHPAVELGGRVGLNGGRTRAAKMTTEESSKSARKAAKARWAEKRQQEEESSQRSSNSLVTARMTTWQTQRVADPMR